MKLKTAINKTEEKVSVGSVRQSQVITTFGVGSMVDFVNQTTMISGTDKWTWYSDENYKIHNINYHNVRKTYILSCFKIYKLLLF